MKLKFLTEFSNRVPQPQSVRTDFGFATSQTLLFTDSFTRGPAADFGPNYSIFGTTGGFPSITAGNEARMQVDIFNLTWGIWLATPVPAQSGGGYSMQMTWRGDGSDNGESGPCIGAKSAGGGQGLAAMVSMVGGSRFIRMRQGGAAGFSTVFSASGAGLVIGDKIKVGLDSAGTNWMMFVNGIGIASQAVGGFDLTNCKAGIAFMNQGAGSTQVNLWDDLIVSRP